MMSIACVFEWKKHFLKSNMNRLGFGELGVGPIVMHSTVVDVKLNGIKQNVFPPGMPHCQALNM